MTDRAIQVGDGPVEPVKVPSRWQRVEAGDRLWVREAFTTSNHEVPIPGRRLFRRESRPMYAADFIGFDKPDRDWSWSPSSYMPRKYSRVTLTVTDIRVERLQDISEADAIAEGVERVVLPPTWPRMNEWHGWKGYENRQKANRDTARDSFSSLWNSLHGPSAWQANPEVVVPIFTVHRSNIDQMRTP